MDSAHIPRYFLVNQPIRRRDPHTQLVASLTRLITDYPPNRLLPQGGFFYGPTSTSLLLFRLQSLYPELTIEDRHLSTWATTYLKAIKRHENRFAEPTYSQCGIIDDKLTLLTLEAVNDKDTGKVEQFCKYASVSTHENATVTDAANEWLYGRAGYLYLLRFIRASFTGNEEITGIINETAEKVIKAILDTPRPWVWYGDIYLGAAHGSIGIITQIVLTDPNKAPEFEGELETLLNHQYKESGNWPVSEPVGEDSLVQFCHGAPGFVTSLQSIVDYFPNPGLKERIMEAIRRGQECILERGLLTKEPCLCHGISGNALALEKTVDFERFLALTTGSQMDKLGNSGMMEKSTNGEGLWTGEAGRAWVWAVADKGLEKRFLGYNDI